MTTRPNLLLLCLFLLLAVACTQAAVASSPRIRGRQLARQLEDQQADDAVAQQDDQQQYYEEEEQEEQEEEDQGQDYEGDYADDVFQADEENKVGQMFETAPENWTAEQWSFMVLLFIGWGALTSCICATGWMCSCLGCVGGGATAKEQTFAYDPSASSKQGDDSPAGCCPSSQDYVAMTGTETKNTGAYS